MPPADIVVQGAREHNLRDVSLVLPRNQLICLTGVSGSGKSSLAFDTLYAEGQRRYVESLSTFARQFLGQMPKPDVDYIGGLSPSISISQKTAGNNPRSTVGTITEIYDYLRLLYARVGQGHCPECDRPITAQSREQIIERILQIAPGTAFLVLAPVVRRQKGEFKDLFTDLRKQGFARARVDGQVVALSDSLQLDRQMRHEIEVVIDRLVARDGQRARVAEAVELGLRLGAGNLVIALEADSHAASSASPTAPADEPSDEAEGGAPATRSRGRGKRKAPISNAAAAAAKASGQELMLSSAYACTHCGLSFEPPSPQLFSFNSPQGMCPDCAGLGETYTFDPGLLIPDESLSFAGGAIATVGPWKELGRWKRHIYQGVADTIERKRGLAEGTMLETPWRDLDPELRRLWLHGTGNEHITFTWRGGNSPQMYGGRFEGIIPELEAKYRQTQSAPHQRQLEQYMNPLPCASCRGERLNKQARAVKITTAQAGFESQSSRTLPEVCHLPVADAARFFAGLVLDETQQKIAAEVLKEIRGRLGFLLDVGLDYLMLDRTAPTLSGGESQRIRLAGQIGCGLVGVLYILDEPSIGLHSRDNDRLIATLARLRDQGNTVLVVEHDEETMRAADAIVDFGPGPGVRGGEVVAIGPAAKIARSPRSVTGKFLAGERKIEVPRVRRQGNGQQLVIRGARHNNLKNVDVAIPLGCFVCVTGVSGSGKSSIVNDILSEALRRDLNGGEGEPGLHDRIEGLEHLDKLIAIDQSPIGRTPRSNPGTYIKVFDEIRDLYTQLPDAKRRGFKPGRFSFNVKGGRCEACEGNGSNRLEMDFLADVWVTCPVCRGHRFNHETLQVRFKNKSIADVLELDVQQALDLFANVPSIEHKLQTLHAVGLDYLKLGQPSPTLSGGEAQRIKLARELVKKSTGQTLYLLDEPTTGLHFADVELLLKVLHEFVDAGNTVLVVEHNLDVIKTADWVIDMGPEGGAGGGQVVVAGTPEQVAAHAERVEAQRRATKASAAGREPHQAARTGAVPSGPDDLPSYTGLHLVKVLRGHEPITAEAQRGQEQGSLRRTVAEATEIVVRGAKQHNLKGVDVAIPRDRMTVFCGPSGSGKSSLAMDTIYAEGQRRYVESLSAYARQFVGQMQKPALDHIEGLSPAIAIEQKNLGNTPRSTVGTVTEIYDYLRILMARLGQLYCPDCRLPVGTQTSDQIVDKILAYPAGAKLFLMAPLEVQTGQKYETLWDELRAAGYARVRIDGETTGLDQPPAIDRRRKHKVEAVIDRITVSGGARTRIAESVEAALSLGKGVLHVAEVRDDVPEAKWSVVVHSQHLACDRCRRSFEPLAPHSFSFNSPLGWCPACQGLGTQVGANAAALVRDPKATLLAGALALWPALNAPYARAMLQALAKETGIPLDVPYQELDLRHKRLLLHGTGEAWLDVPAERPAKGVAFRFQYKGLYPALEEASRLSPNFRSRLEHLVGEVDCSVCGGSRLRDDAANVHWRGKTIGEICRQPLAESLAWFLEWQPSAAEKKVAGELIREVIGRTQFLCDVGLEYLTFGRSANTLSNGEAQRIRLASQLGSGLCGVLYVLDEPTIGLHPRDNTRLLQALYKLRDLGNTLVVVEHDHEVIAGCDALCDFGPGAGRRGGQIVARGTPAEVAATAGSVTGPYLSGSKAIPVPTNRRLRSEADAGRPAQNAADRAAPPMHGAPGKFIEIVNARHNNLRGIDVRIPLGALTAITGPSGSGKSSLIEDVLYASLAKTLHRAATVPGAHEAIRGIEQINKVIRVDQQPLGNSPTSNPATYTGVFELIRQLFAQLPEAKLRGYTGRRFSTNVPGGRCEACEGNGQKKIEMHFLPDVWVECETCRGQRYNPETLAVKYHGRSINDVLEMTCGEALVLFENIPRIRRILQTLCDVGLDYLTLGQAAPTLSGGEAQRVKLAAELARPDTGRTLYLLDEPTTGLHFDDLAKLLEVLQRLVDLGNTVVLIEHNLDVIKSCDWVVDLGPEAGAGGGSVVFSGTPEALVEYARSVHPAAGEVLAETKTGKAKKAPKSSARGGKPSAGASALVAPSLARKAVRSEAPRSYTGEALAPVLAAGPHRPRAVYRPLADQERRAGDLEIEEVGRDARMPWEVDGRRWHTQDRVGRTGEPCKWDGRILAKVVDKIHELGDFGETNWNARSVVEICGEKKSDGWFFHAITGETWLVKLKFRTVKNAFQRDELLAALPLKPLNEMPDLPIYGNEPRVSCKNLQGPWQEVQIHAHSLSEIDIPAFWQFLEKAVAGFFQFTERAALNPEDLMPWKVLGMKWHLARKGFPPGRPAQWPTELLEEVVRLVEEASPGGEFLWNNKQLVHRMTPGQREPWATIQTKRPEWVLLAIQGPKGSISLGRVAGLGADREVDATDPQRDTVKIRFTTLADLRRGDLAQFLHEHRGLLGGA